MAISMFWIAVAGVMGVAAKVASEVKSGEREKFFTNKLWLELPAWAVMTIVSYGFTSWQNLSPGQSVGLTAVLCYLGPRAIDVAVSAWLNRGGPSK